MELITLCDKPVIVVPAEASCDGQLRHVLFGLEGITPTSEVLGPTIELARERGFEVVVVHVDDEESIPPFSDQPQHETDAFASEFLARYGPAVEPSALQLRIGEPAEQVLSTCDDTAADTVVLAWSCSLAPGRAGLVRRILEQARVPVMPRRALAERGERASRPDSRPATHIPCTFAGIAVAHAPAVTVPTHGHAPEQHSSLRRRR